MKKIRLLVLSTLIFVGVLNAQTLEVNNGVLHLKVDLSRGGAICYLSQAGSVRNLVNIKDEGRYVQQSYYAGNDLNRIAEGQSPSWSPWPWNPIQCGDAFGNRAQILASSATENSIYVKCIPMLWDMNNKPAEAIIEQWTTLEGNVLKVHNKLTCQRTDNIYGEGVFKNQELPAVYPISALSKLHSYFATAPYTGASTIVTPTVNLSSGFWGRYNDVTENWMAFTDNSDWGMGVYTPGCIEFLAGMSGSAGGEATSSSTCYIAPITTVALNKTSVFEYDYYLIIGNISQIRTAVYNLHKEPNLNWEFTQNDNNWNLYPNNCNVSSSNGNLVINITGNDPFVKNTTPPQFSSPNPTHLQIRVKNQTSANIGTLIVFLSTGGTFELNYPMTPNSNVFEDISIDLSTVQGWGNIGFVRDVRIDPNPGINGTITFDYIRFYVPLNSIDITGSSSVNMGYTAQYKVDFSPQNPTSQGINYSVSNTAIATINALTGLLTPVSAGTVNVIATSVDYPSKSDVITVQINAYPSQLINTGFESPAVSTYLYNPTSAAWTFSGSSGVQKNGSTWGAATAPEGVQALFLQDANSSISQTINVVNAGNYVIKFKMARRNTQAQTVKVYIDATLVGTFTPASSVFAEYVTSTFAVTDGVHTIKFQSTVSGDISAFIDDVYFGAPLLITYGWEFTAGIEGWSQNPHNVTTSWNSATTLNCNVTGADPYVYNTTSPNFQTTNCNYLEIKVKNSTSGSSGQIYLWTTTAGILVVPFTMTSNSPVYEKVLIDLRTISGWSNNLTVTNVRIDPNAGGETGIVSFDHILFTNTGSTNKSAIITEVTSNIYNKAIGEMEPKIYPNPAIDNVRIELPEASMIDIYSTSGKLVYSSVLKSNIFDINASNWVSGMYMVKIKSESKLYNKKLIVK